jgi:hypothetical protein
MRRSTAPKVKLRAFTEKPWTDGGVSNTKAKEFGFRFDGALKVWTRIILEEELAELKAKCPLKVEVIQ